MRMVCDKKIINTMRDHLNFGMCFEGINLGSRKEPRSVLHENDAADLELTSYVRRGEAGTRWG